MTAELSGGLVASGSIDILPATPDGFVGYQDLDLTGIVSIEFRMAANTQYTGGGTIEAHLDRPDGLLLGAMEISKPERSEVISRSFPLKEAEGKHDLYLTFKGLSGQPVVVLLTLEFRGAEPL